MKAECNSKTKFSTEKDALFYIKKLLKKSTRTKKPIRTYLCRCGAWHLTSKKDYVTEIDELTVKIASLREEIKKLKNENIILRNGNNKGVEILDKVDSNKKLNKVINENKITIKKQKDVNSELIRKIIQLNIKIDGQR